MRPWRVAALVGVLLLAAGGGFAAGRATAPHPSDTTEAVCTEAMDAFLSHTEEGDSDDDLRIGAQVVVQNPRCFEVETRARARDFLDRSGQEGGVQAELDELRACAEADDDRERRLYC